MNPFITLKYKSQVLRESLSLFKKTSDYSEKRVICQK